MKKFIYLLIATGFIAPNFLSFKLAEGVHLMPYRIVLLAVIYLFLISFFLKGKLDISDIKVKKYLWFLILWISYALLSLSWAEDKRGAIIKITFLILNILIIFFVVYYFKNLKDFQRLYYLWLFMLLFLLGLGLWNIFIGQQFTDYSDLEIHDMESFMHIPRATFTNENDYATYLTLTIPFVITFIRYAKNNIIRFLGLFILSVTLYILVLTSSRANYIAILLGLVFWYLFLVRTLSNKIRIMAFVSFSLMILILILPTFMESIGETIKVELISLTEKGDNDSNAIRLNLIKNSLLFFYNSFGFGIGVGNSEYYMKEYGVYYTGSVTNVHNWWFEILVEYGILVFTGYIIFFISLFVNLYDIYKKLQTVVEKKICESLLVCFIVFIFASISSSTILNLFSQWLFFAFSLGFINYYRLRVPETKE